MKGRKAKLLRLSTPATLVLALVVSAATTVAAGNGDGGRPRVISILGVAKVLGQDVIVDVLAVVPPGANANEVAAAALAEQGARPFGSASLGSGGGFTLTGLVWDVLPVFQNYNPGSPKTKLEPASLNGNGLTALTNTHATWGGDATAFYDFNFRFGEITERCPSLVRECRGRQTFDGNNDVAWLKLTGNTLGVAWFGISIDEVDIVLNVNFNWNDGCMDEANSINAETVFLHENGHSVGLGHSDDAGSVMQPFYDVADCDLGTDDNEGTTFLYDSNITGSVSGTVTDDANISIEGATVVLEDTGLSATTKGDGTYTIPGVPDPVTYTATASHPDFGSATISRLPVDGVDGVVTIADFALGVTAPPAAVVAHVESAVAFTVGKKNELRITEEIQDADEEPVADASVSVALTLPNGDVLLGNANTNNGGKVTFRLRQKAKDGIYTIEVTNVEKEGLTYDKCGTTHLPPPDESTKKFKISDGEVVSQTAVQEDECL